MPEALSRAVRPVRLLAAGGTIAMSGPAAVPALDAAGLLEALPELAEGPELSAENVLSMPGSQISLPQALGVVRRAAAAADAGEGVVVTTGTDTLEELAVLSALTYGGEAPIVFTGANRPASRPGADGPANLLDAIALAGHADAAGLGTVVVFGGEIHGAMTVTKVDSTGPAAFGSPAGGPLGRVLEGRAWLQARPVRPAPLSPETIDGRVAIVTATLGDDGSALRAAGDGDGAVLVMLGAGHLPPAMFAGLPELVERVPVLLTGRPGRAQMLFATYGFSGSEAELRASGAIPVPFLSPVAARIALLCCRGAGLAREAMREALGPWDAR